MGESVWETIPLVAVVPLSYRCRDIPFGEIGCTLSPSAAFSPPSGSGSPPLRSAILCFKIGQSFRIDDYCFYNPSLPSLFFIFLLLSSFPHDSRRDAMIFASLVTPLNKADRSSHPPQPTPPPPPPPPVMVCSHHVRDAAGLSA